MQLFTEDFLDTDLKQFQSKSHLFYKKKFETAYKAIDLNKDHKNVSKMFLNLTENICQAQLNSSIFTKFVRSFFLFHHIRNCQDLFCTDHILVSLHHFNKLQSRDTTHLKMRHDVTSLLMLIPAL